MCVCVHTCMYVCVCVCVCMTINVHLSDLNTKTALCLIVQSLIYVDSILPGPDSETEGARSQPECGDQHHGCHRGAGPGGSRGHALLRGRALSHHHGDAAGLQFSGQERSGFMDLWAAGGEHRVREGVRGRRAGRGGRRGRRVGRGGKVGRGGRPRREGGEGVRPRGVWRGGRARG